MFRFQDISARTLVSVLLLGGGISTVGIGIASTASSAASCSVNGSAAGINTSTCTINGVASGSLNLVDTYYGGVSAQTSGGRSTVVVSPDASNPAALTATGVSGLSAGDEVLLYQVQGGTYSTSLGASANPVTTACATSSGAISQTYGYGSGVSLLAGTYETATVSSVAANGGNITITLAGALKNSYTAAAASGTTGTVTATSKFEVVRVPVVTGDATLGATVSALPWDGTAGGIFALNVSGQLNLNGFNISADGAGFRGATGYQLSPTYVVGVNEPSNILPSYSGSADANGQKGEGVYGTPALNTAQPASLAFSSYVDGYLTGDFGWGAIGNGGGGGTDPGSGNDENTGGGGGSNLSVGGRGGCSWASGLNLGGQGGYALSSNGGSQLFFGGGGGAGTINNNESLRSGSGGNGGGLVYLQLGGITGSGSISANGVHGVSSAFNDAAGGGGAGGTVYLQTSGLCDSITQGFTVQTIGGAGGSTWQTEDLLPLAAFSTVSDRYASNFNGNAHGPGGGGTGGALYTNISTLSYSPTGGLSGVTTTGNVNGAVAFPTAPAGSFPADSQASLPTSLLGTSTAQSVSYGSTDGNVGALLAIGPGSGPTASTGSCIVTVAPTTTSSTKAGNGSTTSTTPTTSVTPTSLSVTKAGSSSVTVPGVSTGNPLASTRWYFIGGLLMLIGLGLGVQSSRVRRSHS